MRTRFFGVAVLALLAGPALAQWQALDGGGGGVPATSAAPSQTTPAQPAPSGSGWGSGIQGWGAPATPPGGTAATGSGTSGSGGCANCGGSVPSGGSTPSVAPPPVAGGGGTPINIPYQGQAAQDPRTASMKLTITGNQVTAHVSMQSICGTNVRVGGADIDLVGTLSGTWESQGGRMAGSWTGTDHHCGSDDPNQGQFEFFMKEGWGGKPLLHLRITGKNGRYGWNFTPKGKDFTSGAGGGAAVATFGTGTGFDSPVGRPRAGFSTGIQPPAMASSGGSSSRMRDLFITGTLVLQVGDSELVRMPSVAHVTSGFDQNLNRAATDLDCVMTGEDAFIVMPGGVADGVKVGNAVKVTARGPGKAELWMQAKARCRSPSGQESTGTVKDARIILIGDAAIQDYQGPQSGANPPPIPPGDIDTAVVAGYVRMKDTGEPVAGATVTLVRPEGGAVQDPSWLTGSDGRFRIVAGRALNLRGGKYEVMVQKLRMPEIPGRCMMRPGTPAGVGIDCDLWPVVDHFVTLSRDAPNADAGTIDLDFLRYIPARGGEARKGAKGVFPNIVPYPRADGPTPITDQVPGQAEGNRWKGRFR